MIQPELGKIITGQAFRDAVHVAIMPVKAAQPLCPGWHVGIDERGNATTYTEKPIGIVDPFLPVLVQPGETFYLCLYPNTITSLRHVWTHPAFTAKANGEKT